MKLRLLLGVVMIHGLGFPNMYAQTESNVTTSPTSVDSQKVAQSLQILQEALSLARSIKDRAERVQSLMTVALVLERFDPANANAAFEEVVALVPTLKEGPSFWEQMLAKAAGYEYDAMIYLTTKERIAFQLVELLAHKDPLRALDLALSLKGEYTKALGIESSLLSWPRTDSEAAISKVRNLATGSQNEKPSATMLAALASGAKLLDTSLARELAHRVVDTLSLNKGAWTSGMVVQSVIAKHIYIEPITSKWTLEKGYHVLASTDMEAAKQVLMKLISDPILNAGNLIAFARGVIPFQPELAWQALTALNKNDKELFHIRVELMRLIVPHLPTHLKAEAQEYLLNFLRSLPEPWKFKLTFKINSAIREELRRVAIVSDIIVSLGSINPDTALAQIRHIAFNEYLDKKLILESKNIFKLLAPNVSGLNPENEEARENFAANFFQDLIRLDLALSLLNQHPQFSLAILDSLKNDFWIGLSYTALKKSLPRASGFDSKTEPDPEGFKSRLKWLLNQAKENWPIAAINNTAIQAEVPITKPYRFVKVAELFDGAAAAVYIEKEDSREDWLNYLPFALMDAGRVLYAKDSTAAMNAFITAMNLTRQMPTPAREWALSWNTAVLNKIDAQQSLAYGKEASQLLDALMKNELWGDKEDWLNYLPFALMAAGRVLYAKDSTAAMNAFITAINLTRQMPTPAREWALSWNTAVLNKIDAQQSLVYGKEASQLLDALMKNEPWGDTVPLLVKQVAVFNPDAALKVARKEKDEPAKIRALLAVVYSMNL